MTRNGFLAAICPSTVALAEKAIKEHIAEPLGLSVTEAALGILKIINNNMALAINANSVAKGIDPAGFHSDGVWRCGAAARGGTGRDDPGQGRDLAAAAGDHSGHGSSGDRSAVRIHPVGLCKRWTMQMTPPLTRINAIADELVAEADAQLDADGIPDQARARSPR